jgi:4-amino-4-deoxy-L-arabinose transferase-like glycosyltransferase
MTKYAMAFFVVALLGGMLVAANRRYFGSAWFWCSVLLTLLIVAPNLWWQYQSLGVRAYAGAPDGRARTRLLPCPAYPMLFAAGAAWTETWLRSLPEFCRRTGVSDVC